MRRLGIIALIVLASLCALIGLLWVINPVGFTLVANEIALRVEGFPADPPAIAEGAPFDYVSGWPTDPKWTAILKRRFSLGSSEAALETTLRQQGFKIDAADKSALFEWGGAVCISKLRVDWRATADHRIVSVAGGYGGVCL